MNSLVLFGIMVVALVIIGAVVVGLRAHLSLEQPTDELTKKNQADRDLLEH